ncbi:PadR family transcriptional regulator [Streptomyces sp. NPDC088354]|uniref:PadR family transcriptional regulator n=1 Tax=unclassified Streptomyces TaxID=2593676 RepID=UPI0029BBA1F6|nr:PadR family transcriptional regulator [Streptomyces sp. MI02-7b]MDX3074549.1 PadR family transcriptional regulator [Streptomyces sp. MI02-7b]
MSTGNTLLGLLAAGPGHGYDLKRRHDERFPQARPLAYGQVYTTLQRLVRDGLAEVDATSSEGGPERTTYRLTGQGTGALLRWLAEPVPPAPVTAANEIFAKVTAIIASGHGDPADFLRAQRAAHLARMRELTAVKTAPGAPLSAVLSADYALTHLDADLRWMDNAAQRLGALTEEVTSA